MIYCMLNIRTIVCHLQLSLWILYVKLFLSEAIKSEGQSINDKIQTWHYTVK